MKNYPRQILAPSTRNHCSETIRQNFYRWLTDKEHAVERDKTPKGIWTTAHTMGGVPHVEKELERWRRNNGLHTAPSVLVAPNRKIHILYFWQSVAAVLLLVAISLGYLIMQAERMQGDLIQEFTPVAGVRHLSSPDNGQVQLDSRSTLLYSKQFTGKERCAYLAGETNFKTKPNKKHPFVVKSDDFQVTVLETGFDVSTYLENQEISTTLLSGSVSVEWGNLAQWTVLQPGEQLTYDKENRQFQVVYLDTADATAWQRGELVFSEMAVEDIICVLERKYNHTFVYNLNQPKKGRLSFRFKDKAPLTEVMDIIVDAASNLKFRIERGKCYITRKENKK